MRTLVLCAVVVAAASGAAAGNGEPVTSLLFHASFDRSLDADLARGDPRLYSTDSTNSGGVQPWVESDAVALDPEAGRVGGALRFNAGQDRVLFYKGEGNVPCDQQDFEGTVSFWLRLSPIQDLPPSHVDPIEITEKSWDDCALLVDFSEEAPRQFRFGVFPNLKSWNPDGLEWEDIPEPQRPMMVVAQPPFAADRWTHVAFTFQHFNAGADGIASLYLDGTLQGELQGRQLFHWQPERLAIRLGINYVGWMDELRIFSRALTAEEIRGLSE